MATIQDLLRAKQSKPLQDLLDQYNNGQKFADGGSVSSEDDLKKLLEQKSSEESSPEQFKQVAKINHEPEVVQEPIVKKSPEMTSEAPVDAEFKEPAQSLSSGLQSGMFNSMGAGLGMGALKQSSQDPESPASKLGAMIYGEQPKVPEMHMENNAPSYVPGTKGEGPFAKADDYEPTVAKDEDESEESGLSGGETSPGARQRLLDGMGNNSPIIPKSNLQNILDMFKGTQDTHASDLKVAQDQENKNNFNANLMRGIAQLSAGVSGMGSHGVVGPATVNSAGLDAIQKNANAPVEQYKQNLANEENDPNSAYSRGLKEFLKNTPSMQTALQNNPNMLDGVNGKILKEIAPLAAKDFEAQARTTAAAQKAKDAGVYKDAAMADRRERLDTTTEAKANNSFDKNTKDEVNRLQASKRVSDIIDAVKSGQLIGSSQIRNAITADLGTLALPVGSRATMTDRQKSAINTFSTKAQELESWINNHPNETIPPEYITQLEKENNIFKESYADALRTKTKSLHSSSQNDTYKNTIANRYKEYANQYGFNPDLDKDVPKTKSIGTVKMSAPDGSIRLVPQDQVDAAIKAGGK